MAVNHKSGRLVVDVDLDLKMALHSALASEGMSLKNWFSKVAKGFIADHRQPSLQLGGPAPAEGTAGNDVSRTLAERTSA